MKKKIITFSSIIFILFFILWINGCDDYRDRHGIYQPYQGCGMGSPSEMARVDDGRYLREELPKLTDQNLDGMSVEQLRNLYWELTLREKMEQKTGQDLSGWTGEELKLLDMELEDVEIRKRQEFAAKEVQGVTPIDDSADKTQPAEQASSNMSCKEIIGTWTGESQKTRLTGTVTIDEETFDVNDMWGWWLEEPDSLEIQIWIENDKCFAKVENLDCEHVSFKNGNLVLIQEKLDVRFEGSLVQPGRLEGTYKWQNFLADPGAMIYGDWWVIK